MAAKRSNARTCPAIEVCIGETIIVGGFEGVLTSKEMRTHDPNGGVNLGLRVHVPGSDSSYLSVWVLKQLEVEVL